MKRLAALLLALCFLALPALAEPEFQDQIEYDGFLFGKLEDGWRLYSSEGTQLLEHVWTDKDMEKLPLLQTYGCDPEMYTLRFGHGESAVYGAIQADGQLAMEPQFSYTVNLREGLALIKCDDLYGYVDASGQWVIPAQFLYANDFHEGLAAVAVNGRCGYINAQGQWVIEDDFDRAYGFHCGRAVVVQNELFGLIDSEGNWILPAKMSYISNFSENLAAALDTETDLWGYLDLNGEWAIAPQFRWKDDFQNGCAIVPTPDGLYSCIDAHGNYVLSPKYETILRPEEDRLIGVLGAASTLFDLDGNPISEQDYDSLFYSAGGYIAIRGNQASYIDRDGNVLFQSQYEDISAFNNRGTAACLLNGQYGLIDQQGNTLVSPQYDSLVSCPAGYIAVQSGQYGVLSHTGEVLVPVHCAEIHLAYECAISKYETWIYTSETYHLKTGDAEFYFDILDGAPVPALPSA